LLFSQEIASELQLGQHLLEILGSRLRLHLFPIGIIG